MPASDDRERVAAALPAYELSGELGRGSFGVVWAAEHRRVGRRVAIKQLTAADRAIRERFLAEAKVLAALDHPHVVPLYDYVEDGEVCLLVMERLDGGSLRDHAGDARTDLARACAIAMVTCSAVHHAHARGVLHRDIKPENLMFSSDGLLKVTDFGVAKVLRGAGASYQTASGALKGTPAYMAPEQVGGGDIGPGVDVYAIGLLLYEMLCGRLPFVGEDEAVIAVALRRLQEDPEPLDPDVPPALAAVTMQALRREPGDRYPTAEDLGVAIGRAAAETLGSGWIDRSSVAVMAPGPILDSAHLATNVHLATVRSTVDVGATLNESRPAPGDANQGERKHLTVMFAEVEASFELQETADPAELATIQGDLVRLIADTVRRYEGTVESISGGAVMAVFGIPRALEDHAARACLTALDVTRAVAQRAQDAGRDFDVAVGLSSGDAIVDTAGGHLRVDPTAMGRTTGLAQRIQGLAEAGRVYITDHTERLVRGEFGLTDLGPMSVRGSREPIHVFSLDGYDSARVEHRDAPPLVGREAELAVLRQELDSAAGGRAQVVGVVAEAGGGKSRLCDEFVAEVSGPGTIVRRTTGVSHGRSVPLLPVLALLRDYFQIGELDSGATVRSRVAEYLRTLDSELDADVPLLVDFLGAPDPDHPAPALAPDVRMRRIFDLLRRITARRSEKDLLVLLMEDLHWFDPGSVAFVERLVEWIPGSRTLVLTNFRPEFSAPWMRHSYYRQMHLAELDSRSVADMIGGLLGRDPSLEPLASFVAERTAGNPFFVEEVVRELIESGVVALNGSGYRLIRPVEEIRVPASVQAVLAARIDRLPPAQKELLQAAAVIGRTFSATVLAVVVDREADALDDDLRAMCAAEMLQEIGFAEYRFWHPLTQEVAYETLLPKTAAMLHGRVGEALERGEVADEDAAVLAWHWEHAGRRAEAARWHLRAATFALRSDLNEALRRWQVAVDLLDADATPEGLEIGVRARTLLLLFKSRVGMDRDEAHALYAEGRDLADRRGDLGLRGLLDLVAGSASIYAGDVVGGLEHYLAAADLAESTDDPDVRAALVSGPPFALSLLGPLPSAMEASDRLQAACGDDPERGARFLGYSVMARGLRVRADILSRAGRLKESAEVLDASLAIAGPRGDSDTLCWALPIRAQLAWFTGEHDDTVAVARQAVQRGEDTGNVLGLVLGLEGLALAHLAMGDPPAAIEACERALAEARARSGLNEEAGVLAVLATALVDNGDLDAATRAADEAVAKARERHTKVVECEALLSRAQVKRHTGDPTSTDDLSAALDLVEQTGARTFEPFIREELGELDEARRLFDQIGATGHARRLAASL
jgi:adenylate cyclase